jgi:predicted nucleotidyltransferase
MSAAVTINYSGSPIDVLAQKLGVAWPHLFGARRLAGQKLGELTEILKGETSADVSVVVHGSLARMEFTPDSDLDWTLLVDGQANPQHQADLLRIRGKLDNAGFRPPGKEDTFGTLTFSHPIIHMIGGEEDSNANTTRRILLLLEASTLGDHRQAFENVRKNILHRYLTEDHSLVRAYIGEEPRRVPLFLLNDMARYWRTMCVDFAYKQHDRGNHGYALRSIKLGISRKLIYASGLLACFWCDPDISREPYAEPYNLQQIIANLSNMLSITPLERMAKFFLGHLEKDLLLQSAGEFFASYDAFLGLLGDSEKRDVLKNLQLEEMHESKVFIEARAIRTRFREAIRMAFLEPESPLYRHTISKGVF